MYFSTSIMEGPCTNVSSNFYKEFIENDLILFNKPDLYDLLLRSATTL